MLSGKKTIIYCSLLRDGQVSSQQPCLLSTVYVFIKQFIYKVCARGYLFYILVYYSIQLCFVAQIVPALSTGALSVGSLPFGDVSTIEGIFECFLTFWHYKGTPGLSCVFHAQVLESTSKGPCLLEDYTIHWDLGLWFVCRCASFCF